MSRKMSAARRAAFLEALAETGNQTIAAERAKVSRSWVCLHRASDPQFKADVDAAVAEAKTNLSRADGRKPPSGWGFLDGEELVVKGTNGRRVQIARARVKQWTPRIEDRFLATLAATCNVKAACAEVGMTAASAYGHRGRWPAFAKRWDEAIELGSIQLEFALVAHCCNPFSARDLPELPTVEIGEAPIRIAFEEAMAGLYMHQHEVYGLGGRPGRLPKARPFEETVRVIMRKVEAVELGARLSEAEKAKAEREFAWRRQWGQSL